MKRLYIAFIVVGISGLIRVFPRPIVPAQSVKFNNGTITLPTGCAVTGTEWNGYIGECLNGRKIWISK